MQVLEKLGIYKDIFSNLPMAIIITDTHTGNVIDANTKACKLIGLSYEEITQLNQYQLHPPLLNNESQEQYKSFINEIISNKQKDSFEHALICSNNECIPIKVSPSLINVEDNSFIVYVIKDLRKIKIQENILSYYDKALKKSSSFISFIDSNYIYKSVNVSYVKTFAKGHDSIIGKSMIEILGEEYFYDVAKEKFDRALNGECIDYDSYLEINNETHFFNIHFEPYYSIDNKIVGVVSNIYNKTRYKEYEEENEKKEKLLIQQSKMAAMGEMLENIAHQWRQPLSMISTCSSGISLQKEFGTLSDEILVDSLKTITDTTVYLSQTIDDFKNFFERDKQKIKFNINENTNKTLNLIDMSFAGNNIEVIKDYKDEIEIRSYNNEFMQVLLNIINNAKDAILSNEILKEKRKIIHISIYKQNDNAVIEIKDNAGGIPSEVIDKIFEPYFTTKHQSQGTGIGLFMTREIIVKHMEGKIEVENVKYCFDEEIYKGALFRIII
ncbi:PAS domain-containing sensor histidine kinase [Poseidonibacter sp.]|uniref:sensor histidine kinase n=2 Tax=Poseidonibacter sp. TaxID=2321188 RepID=UPI003C73574A